MELPELKAGRDPAVGVAEALSEDPGFVASVHDLAADGGRAAGDLDERLRRWAG